VQAAVRRSTIIRRLGDDRPRTLATATGFGAARRDDPADLAAALVTLVGAGIRTTARPPAAPPP